MQVIIGHSAMRLEEKELVMKRNTERAYAQLKSRAPSFRESREFRLQDERNSRQQDLHLKDELHLCMLSSFHLLQHMDGKLLLKPRPLR